MRYAKVSQVHDVTRRDTKKIDLAELERLIKEARGQANERETLRPARMRRASVELAAVT